MENVYKTPEAPLVETRGAKRAHFGYPEFLVDKMPKM